jgi:hypothetical protein
MNRIAAAATAIVLLNLLINWLHGQSHDELQVLLAPWQLVYVSATIVVLPIVAVILYWTRYRQWGAWILSVSMLLALAFGVYFHFIADTLDHVSYRHDDAAGHWFVLTAILLIPMALVGAGFGAWSLRRIRQAAP